MIPETFKRSERVFNEAGHCGAHFMEQKDKKKRYHRVLMANKNICKSCRHHHVEATKTETTVRAHQFEDSSQMT